jgi:hypothetical protein
VSTFTKHSLTVSLGPVPDFATRSAILRARFISVWYAAAGVIDLVKAGVSIADARTEAAKTDARLHLERTNLEYRGGMGNPAGIDMRWIESCADSPAPVKAVLEPLDTLLTNLNAQQDLEGILETGVDENQNGISSSNGVIFMGGGAGAPS